MSAKRPGFRGEEWAHRGTPGCKGNVRTEQVERGARQRTTCDSCKLDYTQPIDAKGRVIT